MVEPSETPETSSTNDEDEAARYAAKVQLIKDLSSRGHLDMVDVTDLLKTISEVIGSGVAGNLAYDAAKAGVNKLRKNDDPPDDDPPIRHANNP